MRRELPHDRAKAAARRFARPDSLKNGGPAADQPRATLCESGLGRRSKCTLERRSPRDGVRVRRCAGPASSFHQYIEDGALSRPVRREPAGCQLRPAQLTCKAGADWTSLVRSGRASDGDPARLPVHSPTYLQPAPQLRAGRGYPNCELRRHGNTEAPPQRRCRGLPAARSWVSQSQSQIARAGSTTMGLTGRRCVQSNVSASHGPTVLGNGLRGHGRVIRAIQGNRPLGSHPTTTNYVLSLAHPCSRPPVAGHSSLRRRPPLGRARAAIVVFLCEGHRCA